MVLKLYMAFKKEAAHKCGSFSTNIFTFPSKKAIKI